MPSDVTVNGITVALDSQATADIAVALWEAGVVENIGRYDAGDYLARMITSAAETALWSDALHDDDTEGTGSCQDEIEVVRTGYAPCYEDALPRAARAELSGDCEGFLSSAWLYLASDSISPEQAGHDFQLSRNGHGAGFFDRGGKHDDALQDAAKTFGTFGLMVAGYGDDTRVYGHHN